MHKAPTTRTLGSRPDPTRLRNAPNGFTPKNARDGSNVAAGSMCQESRPAAQCEIFTVAEPRVAVVLGYFNGQPYVRDQLKSILNQTHTAVHIYLWDDKSATRFELEDLRLDSDAHARISVGVRDQNVGCAKNFLNGLASVPDEYEYFAFSDQDDIWYKDKISRAIASLNQVNPKIPALYCARTDITAVNIDNNLGSSPLFDKPPSFANALVQNIGGGNTMVFNKAAKYSILGASQGVTVVSHDWWCYKVVAGAGGHVIYDPEPCLQYRQHARNLVGVNKSWRARFVRFQGLMQGRFRNWNDIDLEALSAHKHLLTITNQRILDDFIKARQAPLLKRLMLFLRSGIYRQTLFGNLGLWLGVLLNKV